MSDEPKDLHIAIPDRIRQRMSDDPELAAELKEIFAVLRQAHHAVEIGQYRSFDDAMEAITGRRPHLVDSGDVDGDALD